MSEYRQKMTYRRQPCRMTYGGAVRDYLKFNRRGFAQSDPTEWISG